MPKRKRTGTHRDVCVLTVSLGLTRKGSMGSNGSKSGSLSLEGPIVAFMTEKYTPESVKHLTVWTDQFGFPKGGSFSKREIQELRKKLENKENELMKKKTVKTEDIKLIESHKKCLKMWEEEIEKRERKQLQGQMVKMNVKSNGNKQNRSKGSIYPSLTGHGGPLLDTCFPPPAPLAPPPYHDEAAASGSSAPSAPSVAPDSTTPEGRELPALPILHPPTPSRLLSLPPSMGLDGSFSPPSSHTRAQTGSLPGPPQTFQAPMIAVMGPRGPAVVFRPWTESDMSAALEHLPSHKASGSKFATALGDFCKEFHPTMPELRRLLMKKLGPTDYGKIKNKCEGEDRPEAPEWGARENAAYVQKINLLCTGIREAFPDRVDMSKITSCKQRMEEDVGDYFHRLLQIFNENSGIEEPTQRGEQAGTWEVHLRQCFLNGLLPSIKTAVETSCVGLDEARLTEVKRHAEHAQKIQRAKKTREKEGKDKQVHQAQLTMLQAVTGEMMGHGRGRGQGHGRGRGRGRGRGYEHQGWVNSSVGCFICGKNDHWARNCPLKKGSSYQPRASSD